MTRKSIGCLALLPALVLVSCSPPDQQQAESGQGMKGNELRPQAGLRVPTWKLASKDWAPHIALQGEISAESPIQLQGANHSNLLEMLVAEGTVVKQGAVLARSQDPFSSTALRAAHARRDALKLELQATLASWKQLVAGEQQSVLNQQALDTAEAGIKKLSADFIGANERVRQMQQQMMNTALLAPFDGVVTSLQEHSQAGGGSEESASNQMAVLFAPQQAIAANAQYRGNVVAADFNAPLPLWPGQYCQAKVLNSGDRIYDAMIVSAHSEAQSTASTSVGNPAPQSKRHNLSLLLDDSSNFLQRGMRFRARCEGFWRDNVIVVPRSGLIPVNGVQGLYRGFVFDGEKALSRLFVAASGDDENVPVLLGLEGDSELIISKLEMLEHGMPVSRLEWVKVVVSDDF
ncbi:MAG: hypothetical protein EX270_13770 [Pseudomonadales bacterium]|nr:MAG: hypothetical protein EX270_13770 [Pseudomonadales bacterium]